MLADFFKRRLLKKGWAIAHEKCHFLVDMDFIEKKITNLTSNFS
jgi:hypothetical protein